VLQARGATILFGADTWHYAELAQGNVFGRLGNQDIGRITRFHPVTVVMAAAWMQILAPLTRWIAPLALLKAMFAAVGAVGVWAAMSACAALVPRRYAVLFGIVYAVSFGVWYFASLEESKIVTASLSSLYIAAYLRLRQRWTRRGAALLTAILLLACLNEIVSGFLVIVPIVDTLVRRGWDWRHGRWIAAHALAGLLALVVLEVAVNGRLVPAGAHPEGASHVSMLVFYILKNDYSATSIYSYVVNWLFFNIAAPAPYATYAVPMWADYYGYFRPSLASYLAAPASACLAAMFAVMLAAGVLPRYRGERAAGDVAGILPALAAYSLLRGAFFLVFNPAEPLLFSSAVTLAHVLLIAVPFAASRFPAKGELLAAFAALLLAANGAFIFAW